MGCADFLLPLRECSSRNLLSAISGVRAPPLEGGRSLTQEGERSLHDFTRENTRGNQSPGN